MLLLATMINYMDRLTINQTAGRVKEELRLNDQQYGSIEFAFGVAFAAGALRPVVRAALAIGLVIRTARLGRCCCSPARATWRWRRRLGPNLI